MSDSKEEGQRQRSVGGRNVAKIVKTLYGHDLIQRLEDQRQINNLIDWPSEQNEYDQWMGNHEGQTWVRRQNPDRAPPPPWPGTRWRSGWWHGSPKSGRGPEYSLEQQPSTPTKFYRPCLEWQDLQTLEIWTLPMNWAGKALKEEIMSNDWTWQQNKNEPEQSG